MNKTLGGESMIPKYIAVEVDPNAESAFCVGCVMRHPSDGCQASHYPDVPDCCMGKIKIIKLNPEYKGKE